MFTVIWDKEALEDLKSLSKSEAIKIVKKVDSYLSQDPFNLGKPLSEKYKGLYRYRIGDYRIIYEINKAQIQIIVVKSRP